MRRRAARHDGQLADQADLVANWSIDKRWTSSLSSERRGQLYRSWQKAVRRTLDWLD